MVSSIGISLSGMTAYAKRLEASASNVANVSSTAQREGDAIVNKPYQAQEVVQTSTEPTGGTQALLRPVTPSAIASYDPENQLADENGIVQTPNVNLEEEAVNQVLAKRAYQANIVAARAFDDMQESLLDITS